MEIIKTQNGREITLKLKGCLDTAATPKFADAMAETAEAASLILEMSELEFISSSALRTLVATKKARGAALAIAVTGANEVIREVFDVTGLDEIFEIR